MKNYLNSKLKIFQFQKKNQFAIINKNLKKNFLKKNFQVKLVLFKFEKLLKKLKYKIKNRLFNFK